jgi:hypothetical protein
MTMGSLTFKRGLCLFIPDLEKGLECGVDDRLMVKTSQGCNVIFILQRRKPKSIGIFESSLSGRICR